MTPMKTISPSIDLDKFRIDLLALMDRYAGALPSDQILAMSAIACGQILAMQDQRTMTKDMAIDIVMRNIELGNQQMVAGLMNSVSGGMQ